MDNFLIGFIIGAVLFSIFVLLLVDNRTKSRSIKITQEPKPQHLEEKDPRDNSENGNCTSWTYQEYCPSCFGGVRSSDILASCCPMCGEPIGMITDKNAYGRYVFRKIFYQGSWKYQYKNHEGPCENQVRDTPFKRMRA